MTIKIYPGQQPSKPIEEHPWAGTLGDWFLASGVNYTAHDVQPVRVLVDSVAIPVSEWGDTHVSNAQEVEIYPIPFGGIGNFINKTMRWDPLSRWVLDSMVPKTNANNDRGAGSRLTPSEVQANTAKLNQTVPETFGRMLRFPDYLVQPRRYFADPRTQNLEMHVCIGPGDYEALPNTIKVGNTLFSTLEGSEAVIYPPGADLSGVASAQNWYSSPEIGSTSAGTAGLDLTASPDTSIEPTGTQYTLSGGGVIVSNTDFPASWGVGTVTGVVFQQNVTVTRRNFGNENGDSWQNEFTADWREVAPQVGLILNFTGVVTGTARVSAVTLDAQGYGTIRLERPIEDGGWFPIDGRPLGNQVMTVNRAGRVYTVLSISGNQVNLYPSGVAGWLGFPPRTVTSAQTTWNVQPGTTYGETAGPFVLCPASEVTRTFEVDFFFPQGLHAIDPESGAVQGRSVGVTIEYRSAGGGAWQPVERVYSEATIDQIGYTVRVDLPVAIRPEVRIRRRGARSTSSQVADGIQWYGARCLLNTPTSYPWTTMSVRLRGLGKISANSENQVNLEVTRKLPTLQSDGSWSAPVATRDVSAAVWYICKTIGYGIDNLDTVELLRLHNIWRARGETFDATLDETTVQAAIETAFASGMSDLTLENGKIKPVRSGIRTIAEQAYSAQNTTRELTRQFTAHRPDDKDGVEVEFQDENDGWATATIKCMLPGSLGLKLQKEKLIGVTDRTRAWRIGMRLARAQRFERWSYSFGTELDALNSSYGSFVSLVGDQSALMLDIQPSNGMALMTVSESLRWKQGDTHVVAYRRADGSQAGPWPATPGANDHQLLAPIPKNEWPVININEGEPPHVYFGPENAWRYPAIIRSVRPSANDTCTVQAVNYDARIYADDDNQPPME